MEKRPATGDPPKKKRPTARKTSSSLKSSLCYKGLGCNDPWFNQNVKVKKDPLPIASCPPLRAATDSRNHLQEILKNWAKLAKTKGRDSSFRLSFFISFVLSFFLFFLFVFLSFFLSFFISFVLL